MITASVLCVILGIFVAGITVELIPFIQRTRSFPPAPEYQKCENDVSRALRSMSLQSYTIFDNLILPSNGNTAHTEIDHVVISPYGIFCIETKSHQGLIYGNSTSTYWKQYLGVKDYELYNPMLQNYKHRKALEVLLGSSLKAPIHSDVVFPNARLVEIDGISRVATIEDVVRRISKHTKTVYTPEEYGRILTMLAYATSGSKALSEVHRKEVQTYLSRTMA